MGNRLPPDGDSDDENDDGIPLEGTEDKPKRRPRPAKPQPASGDKAGTCWVCQSVVWLDKAVRVAKQAIPVCQDCWARIPAAERVKIALQLSGSRDRDELVRVAITVLQKIRGDADRVVDGDGADPFGFFGKRN